MVKLQWPLQERSQLPNGAAVEIRCSPKYSLVFATTVVSFSHLGLSFWEPLTTSSKRARLHDPNTWPRPALVSREDRARVIRRLREAGTFVPVRLSTNKFERDIAVEPAGEKTINAVW